MTVSKSREYIELGGFAAIIVSLFLLAYEIRQNTLAASLGTERNRYVLNPFS